MGKTAIASSPRTVITSPIPGTIVEIRVDVGDIVGEDDVLVVLEAMKMENDIVSPADVTVKEINVIVGQTVGIDTVLAVIE